MTTYLWLAALVAMAVMHIHARRKWSALLRIANANAQVAENDVKTWMEIGRKFEAMRLTEKAALLGTFVNISREMMEGELHLRHHSSCPALLKQGFACKCGSQVQFILSLKANMTAALARAKELGL